MYRTRGARGGSKLNRTLHESPATASLHSATPKRKNVPCSFDFRGGGFFLKWKGHSSFWGSARKDIRAVWRGFNSDSVLPKLFSGDWIFAKPRLIFSGKFEFGFRPQKGVWGMNAGGLFSAIF